MRLDTLKVNSPRIVIFSKIITSQDTIFYEYKRLLFFSSLDSDNETILYMPST